jgi:RNA polymerase sigma factor (sigma-70 family)
VAEERGTLEETLRALPPLEGEALRLKFFADRTTREISQILETSEANVRQLQCRGLKRLRKELIVNAHL